MADFLNDHGKIAKHGADLPHWQQGEAIQFVTFRLGDSMPRAKLQVWKSQKEIWLKNHPEPHSPEEASRYRRIFMQSFERYLDEGEGSCLLGDPQIRIRVEETLMNDHESRVDHHAWVVMPNHVHILFTPRFPLDKLMKTWKGVSARKIGRGSIWQRNYRDTLIRDHDHFVNAVRYIRRNPRGLKSGSFTLWQGERAMKVA